MRRALRNLLLLFAGRRIRIAPRSATALADDEIAFTLTWRGLATRTVYIDPGDGSGAAPHTLTTPAAIGFEYGPGDYTVGAWLDAYPGGPHTTASVHVGTRRYVDQSLAGTTVTYNPATGSPSTGNQLGYKTVKAAHDASTDGDELRLQPGTYRELWDARRCFNFTKALTVRGYTGNARDVVLTYDPLNPPLDGPAGTWGQIVYVNSGVRVTLEDLFVEGTLDLGDTANPGSDTDVSVFVQGGLTLRRVKVRKSGHCGLKFNEHDTQILLDRVVIDDSGFTHRDHAIYANGAPADGGRNRVLNSVFTRAVGQVQAYDDPHARNIDFDGSVLYGNHTAGLVLAGANMRMRQCTVALNGLPFERDGVTPTYSRGGLVLTNHQSGGTVKDNLLFGGVANAGFSGDPLPINNEHPMDVVVENCSDNTVSRNRIETAVQISGGTDPSAWPVPDTTDTFGPVSLANPAPASWVDLAPLTGSDADVAVGVGDDLSIGQITGADADGLPVVGPRVSVFGAFAPAASTGHTPAQAASLTAWIKAAGNFTDSPPTDPADGDGDVIRTYTNLGTGADITQPANTTRPLFKVDQFGAGKAGVYFDGSNDKIVIPVAAGANKTVGLAFSKRGIGANVVALAFGASTEIFFDLSGSPGAGQVMANWYAGPSPGFAVVPVGLIDTGTRVVLFLRFAAGTPPTVKPWVDGTAGTAFDTYDEFASATTLTVGTNSSGTQAADLVLREAMVWDSVSLLDAEVVSESAYLATS